MRRAVQTCKLSFEPVVARGVKIILLPLAQEASEARSDTGSTPCVLYEAFTDIVDSQRVEDDWNTHDGEYSTDPQTTMIRAAKLRRWIKARPENEAALVCHGYFWHFITGDVNEKGEQTSEWFKDAELRTFEFTDGGGDEATIVDTEDSRQKRHEVEKLEHQREAAQNR